MARPGNRATGSWGREQDVRSRMEEKEGGGAAREVFMDVLKRRPARARALPDAAGAKPGGDDTTLKIMILIII